MKRLRLNRRLLAAAGILLLAAGLGLWGIGHGLPFSYFPDEAHFMKRALSFGSGDLNPHWFHKPALYMYVVFVEEAVLFLVGQALGLWTGTVGFGVQFIRDPGLFYLIGRLSTLLFTLLTIAVVIRLGERHFRAGAGFIGGLLLALTAGLIASSQHVKEDVPSMFFATLSLYWILNYTASGRLRDLLVAAVAGGACAATKAYGMALLPPMAAAVIWCPAQARSGARGLRITLARGLAALGCFVIAQFALAPFSFLDPLGRTATFGRIASLFGMIARITGVAQFPAPPEEHIERQGGFLFGVLDYAGVLSSEQGMGLPIAAYSALGILGLVLRRRFADVLLAGYVILFALVSVVVYPGYAEPRHQTPVYPALAVGGGVAIAWVVARLRKHRGWVVAVFAGTLLWPLSAIALRAQAISHEDTRNVAKRWVEQNIPAGARILVDENGPPLLASEAALRRVMGAPKPTSDAGQFTAHYDVYLNLQIHAARGAITYDLDEIRRPWWRESEPSSGVGHLASDFDSDMGNPRRPVGVGSYESYLERGFDYAVVHSESYRSVLTNPRVAARWPSFAAFYRELFHRGRLVREFSDATGPYAGPVVRIYRLAR